MDSHELAKPIEELLQQAISEGVFPGACYSVYQGSHRLSGSVGRHTYCPESSANKTKDIFDLASVSKVIGTTTLVMRAFEKGKIELDAPVSRYIPEFGVNGKESITLRNLLVHNSGLIAFRPYQKTCNNATEVLTAIYSETLTYPTSSKTIYSDLSMILMAEVLRRVDGRAIEQPFQEDVAKPLGLKRTGYFVYGKSTTLSKVSYRDCIPTEKIEDWRISLREKRHGAKEAARIYGHMPDHIQGEVHDPTATAMGGVAGHAGLFSTVEDLTIFMRDFMSQSPKCISTEVRNQFIRRQSTESTRALGWDTKSEKGSSAGDYFGPLSFGHTGYTGTSVWCDPTTGLTAILLTNRVHPSSDNTKIIQFRPRFHNLVHETMNKLK